MRAFSLLLHQLTKTGQDKFAGLFCVFVGERAECIQEYSSGSFVGLGGFGKCAPMRSSRTVDDHLLAARYLS